MRIALIVPGGVDRSGEYRVIPALLALISRLAVRHDVQVFALAQETRAAEWELGGARIHNIGAHYGVSKAVRAVCSIYRSRPFDVVHAIWSGSCGLIAVTSGKVLRIPSLIHVAGGELASIPEIGYGGRLSWRGRVREALTLRAASAVTAASAPTIEMLMRVGVTADRVPLGVDLAAWPPRSPVRRDQRRLPKFIHVASLNRVKDQATLLRALASLARSGVDFSMDVVGEDTLQGEIQSMAAALKLGDKVHFSGFLTQRQLRPRVEAADLMIVSSRHETGPVALLEAAVAGIPTVGTRVGHLAEWAPEAATVVPVGDSEGLANAIVALLRDDDLRMRIAAAAQRRAIREDADHTAQRFQELYERLA